MLSSDKQLSATHGSKMKQRVKELESLVSSGQSEVVINELKRNPTQVFTYVATHHWGATGEQYRAV